MPDATPPATGPTCEPDRLAAPAEHAAPTGRPAAADPPEPHDAHRSAAAWLRLTVIAVLGLTADMMSKTWAFSTLHPGQRRVIIPHLLEFQLMLNPGALFGIGRGQTTLFLIASAFALIMVVWMFVHSSRRRWVLHLALGAVLAGALGNLYDRAFVKLLETPVPTRFGYVYLRPVPGEPGPPRFEPFPPRPELGTFVLEQRQASDPAWILRPEHFTPAVRPVELKRPPRLVGFVRDFIKIPTRWFGGRELWPWVFNLADTLLVVGVGVLAICLWRERGGPVPAPQPALKPQATPEST